MNNINTANSNKASIWKKLPYVLPLLALLNLSNPAEAKTVNTDKFTPEITEILENPNIITNVEQRTGVKLPKGYTEKIRNFIVNNKTLKKESAAKFTEDFIIKEMHSNRGINKENQLLFICCAIGYNYSQDFYTGDDGDNNRMSEFEKVIDSIESCQTRYKNEFMSYMKKRSADAQQRSADAQQRSADAQQRFADAQQRSADAQQKSADAQQRSADAQQRSADAQQRSADAQQRSADAQQRSAKIKQEIMRTDSLGLKEMIRFYNLYIEDPNDIKDMEVEQALGHSKRIISQCKEYGIDYRAILLKEVGDREKVDEMLRFYGVE